MPIKPKAEETEQEFISRCMSVEKESLPEQDQRLAVCYSYWDKREEMETEDITDELDDLNDEVEGFAYATKESEEFGTFPTTDCMEKHLSAGYTEKYAKMACSPKPKSNDAQQGGVVSMSEEFARKAFEYNPNPKETMASFMSRCMSDEIVRMKKSNRASRVAFCYSQFERRYINNIAKNWK